MKIWSDRFTFKIELTNDPKTIKQVRKDDILNGKQMQMQNRLLLKVCVSSRTYQWQCHEHDNAYMGGLKYPITTKGYPLTELFRDWGFWSREDKKFWRNWIGFQFWKQAQLVAWDKFSHDHGFAGPISSPNGFHEKLYHLWVLSWLVSLDTDYMGRFQEKYSGGFFSVRRENGNFSLVFHDYFFQISFFAHTFHSKKRRFEKGTFCVCVCTRYFIRYNILYQIFLSLGPSNPQRRLSVHPFYPNKFPNLRHDLKQRWTQTQQGHKQEKSDI